jgi:hypothetical protein
MQRPAFWRIPHNKPDPDERYYVSKNMEGGDGAIATMAKKEYAF